MSIPLLTETEDAQDVADARATLVRIDAGEGTMPGEVLGAILDDGLYPMVAWRRYRGLSQAELARRTGLSQVWVSRIENGGGMGSAATRRNVAVALEVPVWGWRVGVQYSASGIPKAS